MILPSDLKGMWDKGQSAYLQTMFFIPGLWFVREEWRDFWQEVAGQWLQLHCEREGKEGGWHCNWSYALTHEHTYSIYLNHIQCAFCWGKSRLENKDNTIYVKMLMYVLVEGYFIYLFRRP